jgi:hypothetical protein
MIPSTLAFVDQSPVSRCVCSGKPQQGIPSTPVTTFHMTQGRVEYESQHPKAWMRAWIYWEVHRAGSTSDMSAETWQIMSQIVAVGVTCQMFLSKLVMFDCSMWIIVIP